jgi:hypothetical protein
VAQPLKLLTQADFNNALHHADGFCKADAFSYRALYGENAKSAWGASWVEFSFASIKTVGYVGDRPVCVNLKLATIKGKQIVFYYSPSEVVDNKMIEDWMTQTFPSYADHHTDASNFFLANFWYGT